MKPSPTPQSGFSLIEVLTALAVLAIALSAAVGAASRFADNAAYLRDRTLAHWVAMNQAAERRILRGWPAVGSSKGEEQMGSRTWYWTVRVETTRADAVKRLLVEVRAVPEQDAPPLARLESYLAKP